MPTKLHAKIIHIMDDIIKDSLESMGLKNQIENCAGRHVLIGGGVDNVPDEGWAMPSSAGVDERQTLSRRKQVGEMECKL
ncbi:hypothetical protein N7493_009973 [Penicillium malachiteum]|uniref:Uncharacterized protein n=1 Tax=Penicillium malachiteum TaxID=1324776 RepID=A0AAD6HDX2_9EURO|nr:hypothetical protein N7493_009973 [Penicillium malachiteum]